MITKYIKSISRLKEIISANNLAEINAECNCGATIGAINIAHREILVLCSCCWARQPAKYQVI